MRITGLATGLDIDEMVKSSMKPYRIKIQQQQQQKEILEMKQQLYRDVITDCRGFYDKYFDLSKGDSILLSKNWSTTKFTSSNESVVTVKAAAGTKPGNYTIEGSVATATKAELPENLKDGNKIVINKQEFTLKGKDQKEIAKNLTTDLADVGIKVEANVTQFSTNGNKGERIVLEATVLGEGGNFTIDSNPGMVGKHTEGKDIKNTTITGLNISDLTSAGNVIKIDGKEIILKTKNDDDSDIDIQTSLNNALTDNNIKLTAKVEEDGSIIFTGEGNVDDPKISIGEKSGTYTKGDNGTKGSVILGENDIENGISVKIGTKSLEISKDDFENLDALNEKLKSEGISAIVEKKDGKVIITSNEVGKDNSLNITSLQGPNITGDEVNITEGKDNSIVITDGSEMKYSPTDNSDTIIVDGITFTFSGQIPEGEKITVSGKTDVTGIKDKIVNFVDDYNKLITTLNTMTSEKRNRNYNPLTDEQKDEMSESEIELWNKKVKQGQLYRDNDVSRIANSMKSAMRTLVEGVSGNLSSFGIKPVSDYSGTANGTFTIDEAKLTEALENNTEEVMNLFIATPSSDDKSLTAEQKNAKSGIAQRLKSILYDETVTVSSQLLKKAGIEGSTTSSNNQITRNIEKYNLKIEDMEDNFTTKEQALYSKWATIETMMNNLNSQQSYLTSMLGS